MNQELLRRIPKVDVLLAGPTLTAACQTYPYAFVKAMVQSYLSELRADILHGDLCQLPSGEEMAEAVARRLGEQGLYSLKRVINATGVIVHTNLGRAPLGPEVAAHVAQVAQGYGNLEFDLDTGKRGSRYSHVESLLCRLTGAEAALVVNNNAGAVFLILNTLARGKAVAISRGELVEIGGSFRVPEIMEQSGAILAEVGSTNKTHLYDYERAIDRQGAQLLLKVHTSNFSMSGFTEEVELPQLVQLGRERGCPVLYDAGAAFIFPGERLGLHSGMVVEKCLRCGTDLVCFSGDKLLGSAQAGIIVGKKDYIEGIRQNPLTRMLRIDKLSLAALEASLHYYLEPELAIGKIPVLALTALSPESCRERALALQARATQAAPSLTTAVAPLEDEVGGGSLPGVTLPGYALRLESSRFSPQELEAQLRQRPVPIVGRISKNGVLLSTRTLFPEDDSEIIAALAALEQG